MTVPTSWPPGACWEPRAAGTSSCGSGFRGNFFDGKGFAQPAGRAAGRPAGAHRHGGDADARHDRRPHARGLHRTRSHHAAAGPAVYGLPLFRSVKVQRDHYLVKAEKPVSLTFLTTCFLLRAGQVWNFRRNCQSHGCASPLLSGLADAATNCHRHLNRNSSYLFHTSWLRPNLPARSDPADARGQGDVTGETTGPTG